MRAARDLPGREDRGPAKGAANRGKPGVAAAGFKRNPPALEARKVRAYRGATKTDFRPSRSLAHLDKLRREKQPQLPDVPAKAHPLDERIQQEDREPRSGTVAVLRTLQLCSGPRLTEGDAGDGGRGYRSHLDNRGNPQSRGFKLKDPTTRNRRASTKRTWIGLVWRRKWPSLSDGEWEGVGSKT